MTTQTKALDAPLKINTQHIMVSLLVVATFVFFTSIGLNHQEGETYGWMSLLPTALVLVAPTRSIDCCEVFMRVHVPKLRW